MGVTRVEQTDGAFVFTGAGWAILNDVQASGGSLQRTEAAGDYVEITYSGFGVGLIAALGGGGSIDVWLDGAYQGRFSLLDSDWFSGGFTTSPVWQFPLYFPHSTDAVHVLKVQAVSAAWIFVDAIDVVDARDAPDAGELLAYGDSWVAGVGATTPGTTDFLARLHTMLGTATKTERGENGRELCGYAGIYGYYRALAEIVAETPQTLVIALGYNDVRRGTTTGVFGRYYDALLRLLRARLNTASMTVICCTPGYGATAGLADPVNAPWDQATQSDLATFGRVVRDIAGVHGFVAAEWYEAMNQADALLDADDIHPDDEGHWLLATAIYQAIKAGNGWLSYIRRGERALGGGLG